MPSGADARNQLDTSRTYRYFLKRFSWIQVLYSIGLRKTNKINSDKKMSDLFSNFVVFLCLSCSNLLRPISAFPLIGNRQEIIDTKRLLLTLSLFIYLFSGTENDRLFLKLRASNDIHSLKSKTANIEFKFSQGWAKGLSYF